MNDGVQAPPPHEIPVELFSRRDKKTTNLIGGAVLDGRKRWYEFKFVEPVYIQAIEVKAAGYENWNEVEFIVDHIDGALLHKSREGFIS